MQKLSGAVFCTAGTAEKLRVLDQTNGESVLYQIAFENMLMKKTRVCNQTEKSTALYKTNSDLVLYQFAIEIIQ